MLAVLGVALYFLHGFVLKLIQGGLGVHGQKLLYGVILPQRHPMFVGLVTHMAGHAGIFRRYAAVALFQGRVHARLKV